MYSLHLDTQLRKILNFYITFDILRKQLNLQFIYIFKISCTNIINKQLYSLCVEGDVNAQLKPDFQIEY